MRITKFILAALVLGIFISSCGEESTTSNVSIKLQMKVGDEALVHDNTYTINDVDVRFTNVAFYLGDMKFEDSEGKNYEAQSRYQLIKPGIFDFNFEVPSDQLENELRLTDISFFVGVDAETNAESEEDFTERATDDPLGQQNPSMHWGWSTGYKFLNIDGEADIDGDGEYETTLTYHLGRDQLLKNIALTPDVLLESGDNEFEINFNMDKFLTGIDFATENFTKVQPDNVDLANKLFDNYDLTFSFVE